MSLFKREAWLDLHCDVCGRTWRGGSKDPYPGSRHGKILPGDVNLLCTGIPRTYEELYGRAATKLEEWEKILRHYGSSLPPSFLKEFGLEPKW